MGVEGRGVEGGGVEGVSLLAWEGIWLIGDRCTNGAKTSMLEPDNMTDYFTAWISSEFVMPLSTVQHIKYFLKCTIYLPIYLACPNSTQPPSLPKPPRHIHPPRPMQTVPTSTNPSPTAPQNKSPPPSPP